MIDLSHMNQAILADTLKRLKKDGLHVAFEGMLVAGCGGMGYITACPEGPMYQGRRIALLGSNYLIPEDSHGCPGCPHYDLRGTLWEGNGRICYRGRPVIMMGATGQHVGCCGGNFGRVLEGWNMPYLAGDEWRRKNVPAELR